jgi:hypothetical protein
VPEVGADQPLDPACRSLQHGVARAASEGGVDRIETADRQQQQDEGRLRLAGLGQPIVDEGAGRPRLAQSGERIARLIGVGRRDRLGMAVDFAILARHPHVMRHARAAVLMREGGRMAGAAQPLDRVSRRATPGGVKLAEQVHQADPPSAFLAQPRLAGKRGRELDIRRTRAPAPARLPLRALRFDPTWRPLRPANPLGMAPREVEGL